MACRYNVININVLLGGGFSYGNSWRNSFWKVPGNPFAHSQVVKTKIGDLKMKIEEIYRNHNNA